MCCGYLKDRRLLGEPALRLRWIEVLLDLERLWALGGGIDDSAATARSWNRDRRMYDIVPDPWQRLFDPTGVQIGANC